MDWRLKWVRIFREESWYYRYLWIGPRGTETIRICLGTEDSAQFLEMIWELWELYRSSSEMLDHSHLLAQARATGPTV